MLHDESIQACVSDGIAYSFCYIAVQLSAKSSTDPDNTGDRAGDNDTKP